MGQVKPQSQSSPFGRELRRLRDQRGLSLQKFAELANYSRGYIGKVETGDKPPTPELAQRCDEVLEAGGRLIALATTRELPRLAQLPAAAATFVGRQTQLIQLEQALAGEGLLGVPRTVSIDGPPGAGKTALALRLAYQIKDRFPDGQLYVDLHGHSPEDNPAQPGTVLEEFLIALGVRAAIIPAGMAQRAAMYRSLLDGRRVLLVFDNALDSQQIEPLFPSSVGCGVVVTSRKRLSGLDMPQDQRFSLGPMTEDESMTLLRTVIGASRADEEPDAIQGLARRCGHLPLALRIAAERVATHPHHSVDELVDELAEEDERLDGLSTDDSMAVRNVFSWSYRDLSGEAARMFRHLGLHRGPDISGQAAAALAGVSPAQARRLLDRLASVHLLEGIAGDRYQIHDLLRVYAAERAAAEESEADRAIAVRRVLDWYLHTAYAANHILAPQRHDPVLTPSEFSLPPPTMTTYDEALTWCEVEMPNLVVATRTAVDVGEFTTAWQIPVGCWNYLYLRKHWSPWVNAHEIGLIGARKIGDRFGEAWTLTNLAHAYRELHRFGEARACLEQALVIRHDIGDLVGEAWTLAGLGYLDGDAQNHDEAAERFQQALAIRTEIAERHGDDKAIAIANRHGEGIILANLGDTYRQLRRFADALVCLNQALDISREIDDRHGEGYALVRLGDTYRELRRVDDALDAYHQALTTRREIGDRWGEAETLHNRGGVLFDSGRVDEAMESWRQALAVFEDFGDPRANDVRMQLSQAAEKQLTS